jgi:putative SOS response-associated peptidase YedK
MCARYSFFSVQVFQQEFDLDPDGVQPHYNIAPTDVVPAITQNEQGRSLEFMQWGLVPSWAKDPAIGNKLINARAETLAEKPSFRSAFKKRRCLLPADGFFEWKGEKGSKQPFFVHMKSQRPFAFAGLWEYWESPDGALVTCTIVTTEPNALLAKIHTRMPVIIARSDYDAWLDHSIKETSQLAPLLTPYPDGEMAMHPVTKAVGNPGFESPAIVEPIPASTLF